MKKSIFQLIILSILLFGMIGIVLIVNFVTFKKDNSEYYPSNNDSSIIDENYITLNGYESIEYSEHRFPLFNNFKKAVIAFDNELSFKDINYDISLVKIGDKVNIGDKIGEYGGSDINSDCNGIIVALADNVITIKVVDKIYAKFKHNIYDFTVYHIGDIFDVFKNGIKVTTAEIVNINYYDVIDDCVDITMLINNEMLIFQNSTTIEFTSQNYEYKTALSINSDALNITDKSYQILDKTYSYLCLKNKNLFKIEVEFGISYNGHVEIKGAMCDYEPFDLSGGKLYAKST